MTNRVNPGLLSKLLAATASVAIAGGACEVGARLLYPAPPYPMREPQLLFRARPDVGLLHVPNQTGYLDDGLATINRLGFRGPAPRSPKPDGLVRVLAVGDSTTFGWGVGDEEAYPAQLERRLRESAPSLGIDVINAGVSAYNLHRTSRLLKHFGASLEPDVVLVGLFWNDLPYERVTPEGVLQGGTESSQAAQAAETRGSEPFRLGHNPSRFNRLLRTSRALYVLRHAWLAAVAPTDAATNQARWEMALLEGRESQAIDEAWADISRTLAEIRTLGESGGYAVGVVIIPIRAQVEADYPNAAYQTRARAMAVALGMFVVDPLPAFRGRTDPSSLFIPYDRIHFSAKGNAVLADAVFEALRGRPEFTPDQTSSEGRSE